MKAITLILLLLVMGVNIYFFNSTSEEITSESSSHETKKQKLLKDPELFSAMDSILDLQQNTGQVEYPSSEDDHNEVYNVEIDPDDPAQNTDLAILRSQGKPIELKAREKDHREDIRILSHEIERDQELLEKFHREGNQENVKIMRENIANKQGQLDYLRNHSPKEATHDQ